MSDKMSTSGEIMAAIVKADEDLRREREELRAQVEALKKLANLAERVTDAGLNKVTNERDELREQVDRLWAELSKSHGFLEIQQARTERDELRADRDFWKKRTQVEEETVGNLMEANA